MIVTHQHAKQTEGLRLGPILKATLIVGGFLLAAFAATTVVESAGDALAPAATRVAGFEPSRIGIGGTERVASTDAPIDYLPARLTPKDAEEGVQPEAF